MKCNKQMKALLVAALVVLTIFFAFAPAVSAEGSAVVSVSTEAGAEHGATTTVPIIADDGGTNMCLGVSTIKVTFDPSVVRVTNVETGSSNALGISSFNIQEGLVEILSLDGSAPHNGTVTLAVLNLEAVGTSSDPSPLNITVETLAGWYDPYPDIPYTVSNGTFATLGGPAPPAATPTSQSRGSGGSGGSGGGSGGALSTATPAPTPVSSSTPAITQTPASATVSATSSPHVTPTPTVTRTTLPTSATGGFEAVSAIAGLLAIAYLVMRRRG